MIKLNKILNAEEASTFSEPYETIPIVVGVTGHRDIRSEDQDALKNSIIKELQGLKESYPHSSIVMLNSLSRGGDTLSALCARELNIKLVCALPLPIEEYVNDFSNEDLETFNDLVDYAQDVFVVSNTEKIPPDADMEFYYRQAGIYIVSHSHFLMALWDGTSLEDGNYGTSKMVDLMLNGTFLPKNGKALYTGENEAVLQIYTPNESTAASSNLVGEAIWMGNYDKLKQSLEKTDEFNSLIEETEGNGYGILPDRDYEDTILDNLENFFSKADALSLKFQKTYIRVLGLLALTGSIITFSFLLYENLKFYYMIVVCGIMLIIAWMELYYVKKSDCQNHYIEFRTLAEGLRVQALLRYAGSSIQASELFTWSQQLEKAWIMKAIRALSIGPEPSRENEIIDCWIRDQEVYHRNAAERVKKDFEGNERILNMAIAVSILLYIAAFFFEITIGDLTRVSLFSIGEPDAYRMFIFVTLGTISAATLFFSNYYGKQALSRKSSDHAHMALFYKHIEEQLLKFGQSDELLRYIAHEEIIENSNWASYQSDNKVDLKVG